MMKKIELFATPRAYERMASSQLDYSPGTVYTVTKQGYTLATYFGGAHGALEAVKTGWGNLLVKTAKEGIPDTVTKWGEIIFDEEGDEHPKNCPAEIIECFGNLAVI